MSILFLKNKIISLVLTRKVMTMDMSLSGFGEIHQGQASRRGSAVFLSLKPFVLSLRGHYVMVRINNTSAVSTVKGFLTQTDPLKLQPFSLVECDPRSRRNEQGYKSIVPRLV